MAQLITQKEVRQNVLEELGGYVDTVAVGSTTDQITLTNMKSRFGDDLALQGGSIYLPDDDADDRMRGIEAWDDDLQQITPVSDLGDDPTVGDDVEIYLPGDPSFQEINQAMNRGFQELWRPTWSAIPTRQSDRRYGQAELSWVRDREDVLSVQQRHSGNLLDNEDFEYWGTGDSPAVQGWTLSGGGATVERVESAQFEGPFAVTLTRNGNNAVLTQTIGLLGRELIGKTVTASVQCYATAASVARISITDGVTTQTATHTGGSSVETLTPTSLEIAATATTLQVTLSHITSNGSSTWGRAIAVENSTIPTTLATHGSESAFSGDVAHDVVNTPDGAAIVLRSAVGRGSQLWVQSLKPYHELAANDDVSDCPMEAIMAMTLTRLARRRRRENQERWDEVLGIWQPRAHRWMQRTKSYGPSTSQSQVVIGSA